MSDQWDELERLARVATPGPWTFGFDDLEDGVFAPAEEMGNIVCLTPMPEARRSCEAWPTNAAFIAAANPAAVLELITAARLGQTMTAIRDAINAEKYAAPDTVSTASQPGTEPLSGGVVDPNPTGQELREKVVEIINRIVDTDYDGKLYYVEEAADEILSALQSREGR